MKTEEKQTSAEDYMEEALRLAGLAAASGEVPVGAVVVRKGRIIGRGFNKRETEKNALGHAELEAIREACAASGDWRLGGCELYVTLEPCPMCAGAIASARIDRVFYGVADTGFGVRGGAFGLLEELGMDVPELQGGIKHDECKKLLIDFFRKRRNEKPASRRLDRNFYSVHADELAIKLLGCRICRKDPDTGEILSGIISETECYMGTDDTACHASTGMTDRNRVMWSKGGTVYVYLCYGMHNMLNIVSGGKGSPEAVLIRGIKTSGSTRLPDKRTKSDICPKNASETHFAESQNGKKTKSDIEPGNGPGRLTKYLKIDRKQNGADVVLSDEIWIEQPDEGFVPEYDCLPRVGIDYASEEDRQRLWRFRLI